MNDLIAIVGPTASGKTALAVELAKRSSGEIISADSMLVYKFMNIGTAKPSPAEMAGIPHHMMDLVTPDTVFTVYDYQKGAFTAIDEICKRGKIPVLAGGTGLYIQSVLDSYEFGAVRADTRYREKLLVLAESAGSERLHAALQKVDPDAAKKIHPNDLRRIIRALEFYRSTGSPISAQKKKPSYLAEKGFRIHRIGLTMDRDVLYNRIEVRVDRMLEQGFIDEVKDLHKSGYTLDHYSMQSLGYKQISLYLQGTLTLTEAVADIKKETRKFAKRQYTWFRRDPLIHWMHIDPFASLDELLLNVCYILKDIH